MKFKIASFFSGAGGLDKGFENSGHFNVIYANEYDKTIWDTYRANFPHTDLDTRSIKVLDPEIDVPDCDGIIGGPPCQSWSEAGAMRGIEDHRGQLFFDFINILKVKQPYFFLAENVAGMMANRNAQAVANIKQHFRDCGYHLEEPQLLNVSDYGVPQDRKRIIFVGFRSDLNIKYEYPKPTTLEPEMKRTLRDAIGYLDGLALPAIGKNNTNGAVCKIHNHEYMTGGFSTIYMSRNRVRSWDEPSFTIQAGGRHAPLHPQAPKMTKVEKNKQVFDLEADKKGLYRRLSVRECAELQTFPKDFIFHYKKIADGYKMIGNAVPVDFAEILAYSVYKKLAESAVIKNMFEQSSLGSEV